MFRKTLIFLFTISPPIFKNKLLQFIVKLEGGYMYSTFVRKVYKNTFGIEVGYGSYGGCFNKNNVMDTVVFGNYCSTAPNFKIFRANHPKGNFTTHPILYNPIVGYVDSDKLERPKLKIGHDVWIGEGVIILPNVHFIGNGVIIGAGSIVTKDVSPYSIVVGNPAKEIGKRFDEETISKLENSKWWELDKEELIENIEIFNDIVKGK